MKIKENFSDVTIYGGSMKFYTGCVAIDSPTIMTSSTSLSRVRDATFKIVRRAVTVLHRRALNRERGVGPSNPSRSDDKE